MKMTKIWIARTSSREADQVQKPVLRLLFAVLQLLWSREIYSKETRRNSTLKRTMNREQRPLYFPFNIRA
jgi:hypothetical protein